MQAALRTTVWCALALPLPGCGDGAPVRIVAGRADTVIVHGRSGTPLGARVVDTRGSERRARGLGYHLATGDVTLSDDGEVTCRGRGDAEVVVQAGILATRVTVLCRPIAYFLMPGVRRLMLGGPDQALDAAAIGPDRQPVDVIAGTASVRDTHVVQLTGGRLHARVRGITAVDVEAGDCAVSIPVEVVESAGRTDSLLPHMQLVEFLSMSPGELRGWRVPPGRFEVSLVPEAGAGTKLRLASQEMNCAPFPRSGNRYSCIARDRAAVIVHHVQPLGRGRQSAATLVVRRMVDLAVELAAWRPSQARGQCPLGLP